MATFYILDNDAFSSRQLVDRNLELARWVEEELPSRLDGIELHWYLWSTTRSVLALSDDEVEIFRRSPLTILVGLESFSDSQLRRYGKKATRLENMEVLRRLGLTCGPLLMLWDPWSTAWEVRESWETYDDLLSCPKVARRAPKCWCHRQPSCGVVS